MGFLNNYLFLISLSVILMSNCNKINPNGDDNVVLPEGAVKITQFENFKTGNDWAPAIKKALQQSDYVYFPSGEYNCSQVDVPSGKTIRGAGEKTIFIPLGTVLFLMEGKKDAGTPISMDIVDFSNNINMISASNFKVGDDILIQSQRNAMLREGVAGVNYIVDWVMGRTKEASVFYGEFDVVKTVSGGAMVTEKNRIFPAYYKDKTREPVPPSSGYIERPGTTVHKIDMIKNVTLTGFNINGSAKCYKVIAFKYAKDCSVSAVKYSSSVASFDEAGVFGLTIIHVLYCRGISVKDCHSDFDPKLISTLFSKQKEYSYYSSYNIFRIISSWNSGFENCSANAASHAFNITRSSGAHGITGGDCYVRNCTSSNNVWSGVAVQQCCLNTEITGNTVTESGQGIVSAGRSSIIRNNTVSTKLPFATEYYYTHISTTQTVGGKTVRVYWGGTTGITLIEGYGCGTANSKTVIENNTISNYFTGISVRDGYEEGNIFEEGNILVKGNTVNSCINGFGLYKNAFNNQMVKFNIEISGNTFSRTGDKQPLLDGQARQTSGVFLSDKVSDIKVLNNNFTGFLYGVNCEGLSQNITDTGNKLL